MMKIKAMIMNRVNKQTFLAVMISLGMSGCFSDCKMAVIPANPNLDPLPIARIQVASQADPNSSEQWVLPKQGLEKVWNKLGYKGSYQIKVGILSTGIDYNHPDLRNNIWINANETKLSDPADLDPRNGIDDDTNGYKDDIAGYDFVDGDGLPYDKTGLGTAAAGIIGAVHLNGIGIKGINQRVSLVPVRYIDTNGNTSIPNLIRALNYAADTHLDVIYLHMANIHLSKEAGGAVQTFETSSLNKVLTTLENRGVPVVVSAGNLGKNIGESESIIRLITQRSNVIAVTSVDKQDAKPFIANYGVEEVRIAAPGEDILTTLPGGKYGKESGTSMAAAHVAGTIALALSEHSGNKNLAEILKVLLSDQGSDHLKDLQYQILGGNRLNIAKFLSRL